MFTDIALLLMRVFSCRSCELDEWTQEQLDIMTVSGNGNAKEFFKKHGVKEAEMGVSGLR